MIKIIGDKSPKASENQRDDKEPVVQQESGVSLKDRKAQESSIKVNKGGKIG